MPMGQSCDVFFYFLTHTVCADQDLVSDCPPLGSSENHNSMPLERLLLSVKIPWISYWFPKSFIKKPGKMAQAVKKLIL